MLELLIAGQPVDLPEEQAVALSYQVADLNDLQSRSGGFSETFTLPYTHRNARVLETAHSLDSETLRPYQTLPAELRYNDVLVLSGTALVESAAAEGYQVLLVSAAGALFAAVGERGLRELDLSEYDHFYTLGEVQAAQEDGPDAGYTYPLVNDGRLTDRVARPGATAHFTELSLAVFTRVVLASIVNEALPGYRLTGPLLTDDRFRRHQLLSGQVGPLRRPDYLEAHRVVARTTAATQLEQFFPGLYGATLRLDDIELDPGQHLEQQSNGTAYQTLPEASDYRVTLEGQLVFDNANDAGAVNVSISAAATTGSGESVTVYSGSATRPAPQTLKMDFTLERVGPDGAISVRLNVLTVDTPPLVCRIAPGARVTITPGARAYDDSPVHVGASLPDMRQSDLLLLLANQFGAVYEVNDTTRTVHVSSLSGVSTNAPVDWTDKLDFTTRPRLGYRLGNTARRNVLRYADAPSGYELLTEANYTGAGALACPDQTLPAEIETYVAPVAALRNAPAYASGLMLPLLPRYTLAAGPFELWHPGRTEGYPKGETVLYNGRYWVVVNDNAGVEPGSDFEQWKYVSRESFLFTSTDAPDFCGLFTPIKAGLALVGETGGGPGFAPTAGLTFEGLDFATDLLPAYYPWLAQVLRRVRVLECELRLTSTDVATLDFTRAVRLNVPHWPGYGALQGNFYLNLIDQYQPGSTAPVRCELIALNGPITSQVVLPGAAGIFDYTFDYTFS